MVKINFFQWTLGFLKLGHHSSLLEHPPTYQTAWTACEALSASLGDKVSFPNEVIYSKSINSYWSLTNVDIHPSCVVLPQSAEDVSQAVSTLTLGYKVWKEKCSFAVRGGGHTPYGGAANIEKGIVIDLLNLPRPGVAEDRKSVVLSPSQTWDEVYMTLDPLGLTTPGGRVGGVGVGGLVTGCGISYLSPRHGFACDAAESFEVVLGTGDIVNANTKENPDLWKALRGGSNNFGIVTSITMKTFPQGQFWGGQAFYTISTRLNHFEALDNLINSHPYDVYAHFINTLVISNMTKAWVIGNSLQYTKDNPPQPFPNVFKPFTELPRTPIFPGAPDNTFRVSNLTGFVMEYASLMPYKKRWLFATISFGATAEMMEEFFQLANQTIQPFVSLAGFQLSISYQPLPTVMTKRNGRVDSLGPIQTAGNMVFIHWAMAVDESEAHMDEPMRNAVKDLFAAANSRAAVLGVKRDFLALTYADGWQDPIGSRSPGTVEELLATSQKYDPMQVFQKQVPGGFKLPRPSE